MNTDENPQQMATIVHLWNNIKKQYNERQSKTTHESFLLLYINKSSSEVWTFHFLPSCCRINVHT